MRCSKACVNTIYRIIGVYCPQRPQNTQHTAHTAVISFNTAHHMYSGAEKSRETTHTRRYRCARLPILWPHGNRYTDVYMAERDVINDPRRVSCRHRHQRDTIYIYIYGRGGHSFDSKYFWLNEKRSQYHQSLVHSGNTRALTRKFLLIEH